MTPGLSARRLSRKRAWPGLNAFEASYEPHSVLAEHVHGRPLFTYVLRGDFTEHALGSTRDCSRGTVMFRAARDAHKNVVGARGTASFNLEIDPESLDALGVSPDRFSTSSGHVLAGDIEWRAYAVWREFHRDDHATALGMSEAVALLCAAAQYDTTHAAGGAMRRMELAAELIGDGRGAAPDLLEVARVVGVHPMHLAKLFRRRYGYSMGEFVRRRRIAWACGQLADESLTISAIAADAGFADHAHFTRTFRRLTGRTPQWHRARLSGRPGA